LTNAPINVKPEGAGKGGAFEFQIRFFVKHPILTQVLLLQIVSKCPYILAGFLIQIPAPTLGDFKLVYV
jgi:hypothetical protein